MSAPIPCEHGLPSIGACTDCTRKRNRERKQAGDEAYRRRAYDAEPGPLTSVMRKEIARMKRRSDGTCAYCQARVGVRNLTLDHVVPLSRGGTNWTGNLALVCNRCKASDTDY